MLLAVVFSSAGCGKSEGEAAHAANPVPETKEAEEAARSTPNYEVGLYIFILAGFLGYHVISRVPPLLHTPLMSATNAISGISLIGSLVVAGADYHPLSTALGFIAVACSSTNVVGGFLITDRMLKMFKSEKDKVDGRFWLRPQVAVPTAIGLLLVGAGIYWLEHLQNIPARMVLSNLYIVSSVLFILGLKGLSSPKYARRGMFLAEFGMLVAIVGTLFDPAIKNYLWIVIGLVIGSTAGATMGLRIPMTAVPQRTALSHSLGALAATLVGISHYLLHYNHF